MLQTKDLSYPDPDTSPKIRLDAVPNKSHILGLAPIGVRWEGVMANGQVKPDKGCPAREFVPCFAWVGGVYHEIVR